MPFETHDSLPLWVPERYDERMHDFITVAGGGGGGVLGSLVVRKLAIDATAWIVGNNTILTATGGAVRIESFYARIVTSFTSGGAPTLDFKAANTSIWSLGELVANLVANNQLTKAGAGAVVFQNAAGIDPISRTPFGSTTLSPITLRPTDVVQAAVGVAVYTAGAIDIAVVYTPLTSGATLV